MKETTVINFLRAYKKLIKKYKICIDACGCCDGIYLSKLETIDGCVPESDNQIADGSIKGLLYNMNGNVLSLKESKKIWEALQLKKEL